MKRPRALQPPEETGLPTEPKHQPRCTHETRVGTGSGLQSPRIDSGNMVMNSNVNNNDFEEPSNKDLNMNSVLYFLSEYKVERKNTVVNLSTRELTTPELTTPKVLAKGLNYCPTPGEPVLGEKYEDRRWDSNRQHIGPESNVLPTEPPRFSQWIT